MKQKSIDFLVGLFVIAGLAALTMLALKTANLTAFLNSFASQNTYTITAEFDNIGSLKNNAPIKVAGVVIGRVNKIALDPKSLRAVVTMRLDKTYPLNQDASIKIATAGLLGDQYISLSNGPEGAAPLKAGDKLDMTQSAIVIEDLISKFLYDKAAEPSTKNQTGK